MIGIKCEVLENGDLRLQADEETRAYIAECEETQFGYWNTMASLFEHYATNGGFEHFDAGEADPFVGLSSAPCIAEGMDYPDEGGREIVGRLWWFPDYAVRDDLEELQRTGETIYRLA